MIASLAIACAGLAAGAAVLALVLVPPITRIGNRWDIVDRPGGHHGEGRAVPTLGGVAIALSFAVTLFVAGGVESSPIQPLFGETAGAVWFATAGLLILLLGLIDDILAVGPAIKITAQAAIASLIVYAGQGFVAITNPVTGGVIDLGVFGPLTTVVWIVAITNAFNLIDGLDGLASGVALIATATLFGIALLEGRYDAALVWAAMAGSLIGFLPYNFPPASIFLGDCGSLFLGFTIAVLSIQSLQKGAATVVITVPVLALGLPIADAAYAVVRRWLVSGAAAIARADRDHIHHRLLRYGLSHRRAVLILYGCCAAFSGLAFLAVVARGPMQAVLVALAAAGTAAATRLLERREPRNEPADRSQ